MICAQCGEQIKGGAVVCKKVIEGIPLSKLTYEEATLGRDVCSKHCYHDCENLDKSFSLHRCCYSRNKQLKLQKEKPHQL